MTAGLPDQSEYFGVSGGIVAVFDEDDPVSALRRGVGELLLGGGQPPDILRSVIVAKQSDVNRAAVNCIEVHVLRIAIRRWQIFKQEHIEVAQH